MPRVHPAALVLAALLHTATAVAVTRNEAAEKAGFYFAAVVVANEFKNGPCGPHMKIASRWTDVGRAQNDILAAFPKEVHSELRQHFPKGEAVARQYAQKTLALLEPDAANCKKLLDKVFWPLFDKGVTGWDAVKSTIP